MANLLSQSMSLAKSLISEDQENGKKEDVKTELQQAPEHIIISAGPTRFDYTGHRLATVGKWTLGIGGVGLLSFGIYKLVTKNNEKKNKIEVAEAKSQNKVNEHHEASKDDMAEDDNRTDNKIRYEQAQSEIRMEERRQIMEMKMHTAKESPCASAATPQSHTTTLKGWIENFRAKFPMPDYSSISFLASILDGCPEDYKDAMLLHLNTELGALCFSKVRAKYLDSQFNSPSLQTIVEGEFGSGKAKFYQLHNSLFKRVIDRDAKAIKFDEDSYIIQTAGINISQSKFFNIVASNHGVHIYAIETEISTVEQIFKKPNGLGFDYLRKAFHNEPIYQNNKGKDSVCGMFPVYLNYTFTGTPKAISSLIDEKEIEGGTASRICFTVIPEVGRSMPSLCLPSDDELKSMQDQIDEWREIYCFTSSCGSDTACPETTINLDYVNEVLKQWLDQQYDQAVEEGNSVRKDIRARMATIAFHNAIVLHMMAGNPQTNNRKIRKTIAEMTIYIANYCMERYLTKFSSFGIQGQVKETSDTENSEAISSEPIHRKLTEDEIEEWYYKRGTIDADGNTIGYGTIAKQLNVDKDSVVNSFKRYEKKMGMK